MLGLVSLLIVALIGALLRAAFLIEIPWLNYINVLHAHTHVAILGWVYVALFAILTYIYRDRISDLRIYARVFWVSLLMVLGMLITFPVFGYTTIPLMLLTTHLLLSYVFVFKLSRDIMRRKGQSLIGDRLVLWALGFYLLPTRAETS